MSSTFLGLRIGQSGLSAAQIALNITGQNLSNADTEGYTRQTVSSSAVEAPGAGYLINQITASSNVGQGVEITSITQVRSAYLDQQFRDQYADFCYSEYTSQGYAYLEDLFDELDDDTSLTVSISDFFDSLSDFAENPSSESRRTAVQQAALAMTQNFNDIYDEMVDLYNSQNTAVETVAAEINEIAKSIAELNEAIVEYEVSGESANNLRDERNLLLDKLSGYVNITYSEDESGMVGVQIAGETLVDGKTYNEITTTTATDEINSLCGELALLNEEIMSTAGGITAEQAAERDAIIASLEAISGKITCTVDTTSAGVAYGTASVEISYVDQTTVTPATDTLVSVDEIAGTSTNTDTTDAAVAEYDGADVETVLMLGDTYLNSSTITSGELYAHLFLRDGSASSNAGIPYYISQFDELVQTIVQTVNECMNGGYTYPDEENGFTSVTGETVDLFEDFGVDDPATVGVTEDTTDYSLVTAGNFSLSEAVASSVWNIAASDAEIDLDAENTQSTNNIIALKLAELIDTNDYSGMLDSFVTHLGLSVSSSGDLLNTRESLLESTANQRKSISGVSRDEETVNLIMYQQTYNACSRMITTMDEMLDKLINGTGTVGL